MRNIKIPTNLISELNVPQIIDITDELPKCKPYGWDGLVNPRSLEALTDLVWHHSGMFLSDNLTAESHAKSHVNKGEGGCPYHFHIKDGQIRQTNDILTFTYGVASNNTYTIHICVEGCYSPKNGMEPDVLTDDNLRAMIALELTLRPLLPNYKASNGHNYYKPTACPGFSMTKFKEEINTAQLKLHQGNQWAERVKKAGRLNSQINFMDSLIAKGEDDKNAAWALYKKELVYKIMESQKLL
jgi:hypothetical protein